MNYSVELKVYDDIDTLYKCFLPEIDNKPRSEIKLSKKKDYLLFEITSKDATALKATLIGITKLLQSHEKINKSFSDPKNPKDFSGHEKIKRVD